ncbi:MAG: GGDEF domain-containing protein [Candidatus Auribacterota bacterium]
MTGSFLTFMFAGIALLISLLFSRSIFMFILILIVYGSVSYVNTTISEFTTYAVCLGSIYISVRYLYQLFEYDSGLNTAEIEQMKAQQIALCTSIDTLETDRQTLEQGYASSLQMFDLIKLINKEMDFKAIFSIFSGRLIEKCQCSQCGMLMFSHGYKTVIESHAVPEDSVISADIRAAAVQNHPADISEPYRIYKPGINTLFYYFPPVTGKTPVLAVINITPETTDELQSIIHPLFMELKKSLLYEKIRHESIRDGLTGLYQRRYCMANLEDELERAKSKKLASSILILDIDDFKTYNDTYGHLAGDFILRQMADILSSIARSTDFAGRIGGEEFIVFLHDTEIKGAVSFAERLRKTIEEHIFAIHRLNLRITVSIGIANTVDANCQLDTFLAIADANLYRAKKEGKNRVCF